MPLFDGWKNRQSVREEYDARKEREARLDDLEKRVKELHESVQETLGKKSREEDDDASDKRRFKPAGAAARDILEGR